MKTDIMVTVRVQFEQIPGRDKAKYKDRIQALWKTCGVADPGAFKPKSTHVLFIALAGVTVVGVGSIVRQRGPGRMLRADAVLPEYQGLGVHKNLIQLRIEHAKATSKGPVLVSAHLSHPVACHNYILMGFRYRGEVVEHGGILCHKMEWTGPDEG